MLLSDEEIRTLTFKAPYVYEHGDRPYFIHEVNRVAERLGEQSTLNFFVRYRSSKEDANQHKWSRIVKVVSLAEWGAADREQKKKNAAAAAAVADNNNSSNSGRGSGLQLTIATDNMDGSSAAIANGQQSQAYTSADVASSTMPAYTTWRRKTFTTSFVLEGEEDLVYFQRLSANLPSKEEVADYCARQAARVAAADGDVDASSSAASSLRFIDAVDTAAAPSVLGGVINSDNTAAAVLGGNNSSLRSFLPTSKQIEKLRVYKQAHITEHQWTSQEIEQTREMNARLGRVGAAAAPVAATRNQVHNMKVETELGIARTSTVTGPGAGVGPMMAARRATASDTLDGSSQERMLGESIGDESTSAFASHVTMMSQQQTSFVTGTPQSVCMSPRSPFLPRKLQQRHIMPVAASSSSSSLFPEALLGTDSQSSMTWGDTAHTPLSTQLQQGSPPLASQQQKFDLSSISIASETLQQWEQSAHHEHRFYSYISNAQRSAYVNKVAAITQRNYGENKRIRLQGIDNEKRLERKGNLLESGGLWVTDDVTRAKKAALYKASMEEGSDGGGGAGKAADAGGDKSEKTREEAGETRGPSAQDIAVEKFLKRRRLQELPFDEAIPDSLLEGEEEIVVGEGVAVAIPHGVGRGKVGAAPASGEAGMNARLRVSLTESPPEVLRSQLLVRSSSRMALGGRSSSEKASH